MQDLLQTWSIDSNKLSCSNISLGKLKRELTTVERDPVRDCVYFGTSSGDIIKVHFFSTYFCLLKTFYIQIALNSKAGGVATFVAAFVRKPKKGQPSNAGRFSGGVNKVLVRDNKNCLNTETLRHYQLSPQVLPNGELLVGTGSGEVITVEMGDVKKSSPGFATMKQYLHILYFTMKTQWFHTLAKICLKN